MLLRGLFLVLGFFILSSQASANTFIGNQRKQVSADAYPFRAVVRIHPTKKVESWCSGFLIGPRELKTAIHCLKNENEVPFEQVYVSIASNKYPGYSEPILVNTGLNPNDIGKVDAVDDEYTLVLDKDIGTALGYFGVNVNGNERLGFRGTLDDVKYRDPVMADFCSDSYTKPIEYINDVFSDFEGGNYFTKKSKYLNKYKVCSASYPNDMSLDKITVEDTCALAGITDDAMVTNCSVTHGSSGGAFFYRKGSQYFAYGVISRGVEPKKIKDGKNVNFGDNYFNIATMLNEPVNIFV